MTQTPSYRQLRRSQTDRKISGVCGGIADYLNVDPTVIRLSAIGLTIITGGAFILAYLVAIVVMPDSPKPAPVWNYAPTDRPGQDGFTGTTPQGEPFPGYPSYPGASTPNDK